MYWFNTLQFTRPDILKLPSYSPARLGRRAQNYLLLGFSLPVLYDLHAQTSTEYLKALNSLFSEFDTYQSMHPPDGGGTSSLSRARIPQMFKRATQGGKARRNTDASLASSFTADSSTGTVLTSTGSSSNLASSGATATLNTNVNGSTNNITGAGSGGGGGGGGGVGSMLPSMSLSLSSSSLSSQQYHTPSAPLEPLLPSEHYTHLLTPPLPFDPDFFETFATLCDVLIDSYTRVTQLISESNEAVTQSTGELFAKADSKVRKVIVSGMMREFEERTREGLKGEIAGIGKVVLGGLM